MTAAGGPAPAGIAGGVGGFPERTARVLDEGTTMAKPVMQPGPTHPITIAPHPAHVVVTAGGQVVADTRSALALQEANYPAVLYIPRDDADLTRLERTDHTTYCPYKGDAAYYSIPGADGGANAVWTYEAPYEAVSPIKDHLAFYAGRVEVEERPL